MLGGTGFREIDAEPIDTTATSCEMSVKESPEYVALVEDDLGRVLIWSANGFLRWKETFRTGSLDLSL